VRFRSFVWGKEGSRIVDFLKSRVLQTHPQLYTQVPIIVFASVSRSRQS
jgi:hypothetical protein